MKNAAAVVLAFLLAAPLAAADLQKYKAWADSPEAFFLSKAEREQWGSVTTDAAAEKFIAAYKDARGKGFAAALQSRIDVAEKTYRTGTSKGARSPLGRTLILLGSPTLIQKKTAKEMSKIDMTGSDSVASGDTGRGGGAGSSANPFSNVGGTGPNTMRGMEASEPSVIRWIYQETNIPMGAGTKEFTIEFNQDAAGEVTFRNPAEGETIFQKVIEYWAPKGK
ncbi:MAG: hypothetical protein ACHQPI_03595 [Thermoanaerobaculia bacterium]